MKRNPAGAGYDGNPRRRLEIAAGETRLPGLTSYSASIPIAKSFTARCDCCKPTYCPVESGEYVRCVAIINTAQSWAEWPNFASIGVGLHRSEQLGTEAAETLRSPSGGVPAARGEAADTSERSERERVAVRFAVEAVCCGVVGCQRGDGLLRVETPHGPRVLCPAHLRRWGQ